MGIFDARYDNKGEQDRPWHGSPTFYKLLEVMAITHDSKSQDYASDENPYGNYHFAGQLAQLFSHSYHDMGFIGRLGEKIYRLANLEANGKTPQNESIEDTERDICVITALWMADRRDRRAKGIEIKDKLKQQMREGLWEGFPSKDAGTKTVLCEDPPTKMA